MDFTNLRVLVIGDSCLDVITNGQSTRLSPEAPVPVIYNPYRTYSLGMAANVAANLNNLGCSVDLFTFIGADENGKILREVLESEGITDIFYPNGRGETIVKERIMANGHQVTRLDIEGDYRIDLESFDRLNILGKYDFIVISDYNKGFITTHTWQYIYNIICAHNKGEVFVDTKKLDIMGYFEGYILFPNSKEMQDLLEANHCHDADELRVDLDSDLIVETASDRGALAYSIAGYSSPAVELEVVDVCGAGDTFISTFAAYYTKTQNIQRSLDFANYCCSKVVTRKGTVAIKFKEALEYDFKS
jgi:rfaE bifunctional protein kinase chain/domain